MPCYRIWLIGIIVVKVLFEMRKDMVDLKRTVLTLLENEDEHLAMKLPGNAQVIHKLHQDIDKNDDGQIQIHPVKTGSRSINPNIGKEVEESHSLEEREKQYIKRVLDKHQGNRRAASKELGISERTMYRKIKDYNLE